MIYRPSLPARITIFIIYTPIIMAASEVLLSVIGLTISKNSLAIIALLSAILAAGVAYIISVNFTNEAVRIIYINRVIPRRLSLKKSDITKAHLKTKNTLGVINVPFIEIETEKSKTEIAMGWYSINQINKILSEVDQN